MRVKLFLQLILFFFKAWLLILSRRCEEKIVPSDLDPKACPFFLYKIVQAFTYHSDLILTLGQLLQSSFVLFALLAHLFLEHDGVSALLVLLRRNLVLLLFFCGVVEVFD